MPEQVERSLDRDRVRLHLQQVVSRLELLVDPPRLDVVARLVEADHLLDPRADDVCVHADAAHTAELEEREEDVVVAGVEVETGLLAMARLVERSFRPLHRRTFSISASLAVSDSMLTTRGRVL